MSYGSGMLENKECSSSYTEPSGSDSEDHPDSDSDRESVLRYQPKTKKTPLPLVKKSNGHHQHREVPYPVHVSRARSRAHLPLPPRTRSVRHKSASGSLSKRFVSSENVLSPRASSVQTKRTSKQRSPATPLSRGMEKSRQNSQTTPTPSQDPIQRDSLESGQVVESGNVANALKNVTNLLNTLIKRVEDNSEDIKSIKLSISASSSGTASSSSDTPKKRKVPAVVRKETRQMYSMICDQDEDFGFIIGPEVTFTSDVNGTVASRVIKEVKGQNPEFQTCDIRESIYTYYKSMCQERSAERRGLKEVRQKNRKLRERITRKLQERKVALQRSTMSSHDKRRWSEVMVYDMMSSEEDASEDDCIIVCPLSWRSKAANEFFKALDDQARDQKSSQALRQMKRRVIGPSSERPRLVSSSIPQWAFFATDSDVDDL